MEPPARASAWPAGIFYGRLAMKQKRIALLIVVLVWTLFACSGTMQDCTGFIGRSGADYFVVTEDATGEDVGFRITEETELRIEALAAKEHGIDRIVAGLFVTVALGEPAERPEGFIGKSPHRRACLVLCTNRNHYGCGSNAGFAAGISTAEVSRPAGAARRHAQ